MAVPFPHESPEFIDLNKYRRRTNSDPVLHLVWTPQYSIDKAVKTMRCPVGQDHQSWGSDSEDVQFPSMEQEEHLCPQLQQNLSEKDIGDDDDYEYDDDDDDILYVANPETLRLNIKVPPSSGQGKKSHSGFHRVADISLHSGVFNKSLQLYRVKTMHKTAFTSKRNTFILQGLAELNQINVPKEYKLTISRRSTVSSKDSQLLCLQSRHRSKPDVLFQSMFSITVLVTCVKADVACEMVMMTMWKSSFCSSSLLKSEKKRKVSMFLFSFDVPLRQAQLTGLDCTSGYRSVDEDEQESSDVEIDVSESDSDSRTLQDDNDEGGHHDAVSAGYTVGRHELFTGMDMANRSQSSHEITRNSTLPVQDSTDSEVSPFLTSQLKNRPEVCPENKDHWKTAKKNALDLEMQVIEMDQRSSCSEKESPKGKDGKKDKENGIGNGSNIDENSTSWLYSTPNFTPGTRDIFVAMLKTPTYQALPTSSILIGHRGMESEWDRLSTFYNFIAPTGVFVLPIAAAGFFLASSAEDQDSTRAKVECAFCGVVVEILKFIHNQAMVVHREVSPGCRFVQGRESVGNVSFPQIEENTASQFLQEFTAQAHARGPPQHLVDLQTDAESVGYAPAVERLAAPMNSSSLPTAKGFTDSSAPQLSTAVTDSATPLTTASTQSTMPRLLAGSIAEGQTVPDTRMSAAPVSAGEREQSSPSSAGSRQTARSSGPIQSATVAPTPAQAESSPSENRSIITNESSSHTNTPAAANSQPNLSDPQANIVESVSGGTARIETPSSSSAPPEEPTGESEGERGNGQDRQVVTYDDLGIFAQRPKRPDLALKTTRISTFTNWTHTDTHPVEEMAEAGFYFTGHDDLVRCFHCKGGLKTWESSDKPWVEHSRWFPKCPFVRLCKGQRFVDAVQKLNNPETRPTISEEAVQREMERMETEERSKLGSDIFLLSRLPRSVPERDPTLGALAREGLKVGPDTSESSLKQMEKELESENEEMRDSTRCKMCQINDVNVLFLPCGHLVSCAQCAPALRTCAMCRQQVKGSVRVYLEDKYTSLGGDLDDNSSDTVSQQATL